MKSAIVALCFIGCALAAPPSDAESVVLRSESNQEPEGNFQYSFETDNGIATNANGVVKPLEKDVAAIEINGSNQYTGPDGQVYLVTYVANENGYQPQGAHLPTTPPPQPIPEYIVRSLEYNKAHPYVEKPNKN